MVPGVDLQEGVAFLLDPSELKSAAELAARAFQGTETTEPELLFDWGMGPELKGKWEDPKRTAFCSWMLHYLAADAFLSGPKGVVLTCKDGEGKTVGVAFLKIWRDKVSNGCCHDLKTTKRVGMPNKDVQAVMGTARWKAVETTSPRVHKQHASGPHMYVAVVAVDCGSQGQGVGGKLMRSALAICDQAGLPAYLECAGERNMNIYEKYGFKAEKAEVKAKAKKGQEEEVFEFYAMVRPKQ